MNVTDLDMTVNLTFPPEIEKGHMVMPGDNVELVCELLHPLALDKGMRFTIRISPLQTLIAGEGGLTVGTAIVTQILE